MPQPIIWPLLTLHPLFMQTRPSWTAGLAIPSPTMMPWNSDWPAGAYAQIDAAPIVRDVVPINFGLAALQISPPTRIVLQPSRTRSYQEQSRVPAVVRQSLIPPTFFQISQQTRDSTGAALGSATSKLFVTATDAMIETQVSNADGYAYFKMPAQGVTHYIVSYKAGTPDVTGATVNTLIGA